MKPIAWFVVLLALTAFAGVWIVARRAPAARESDALEAVVPATTPAAEPVSGSVLQIPVAPSRTSEIAVSNPRGETPSGGPRGIESNGDWERQLAGLTPEQLRDVIFELEQRLVEQSKPEFEARLAAGEYTMLSMEGSLNPVDKQPREVAIVRRIRRLAGLDGTTSIATGAISWTDTSSPELAMLQIQPQSSGGEVRKVVLARGQYPGIYELRDKLSWFQQRAE